MTEWVTVMDEGESKAHSPLLLPFLNMKTEREVMNNSDTNMDLMNDKLVNMAFITQFTGLTDKWFYKLISEKKFPKPIKLGRSSRWRESEVHQWLTERIDESRNS